MVSILALGKSNGNSPPFLPALLNAAHFRQRVQTTEMKRKIKHYFSPLRIINTDARMKLLAGGKHVDREHREQ